MSGGSHEAWVGRRLGTSTVVTSQDAAAMREALKRTAVARLLPVARAVREQVDWPQVRDEMADNDYAAAFLYLLDRLAIPSDTVEEPAAGGVTPLAAASGSR